MPCSKPTRPLLGHCIAALLLLAGVGSAHGHVLSYPRLVHLRFGPELIEVAVQVTVHAGPKAQAYRDRHDADKDGVLDDDERMALARTLDAQGRSRLKLTIDGVDVVPEVGVLELDLQEDGDGQTLALKSVAAVAVVLLPGPHEVRVEDLPPSPRATVPLRLEADGFGVTRAPPEKDAMPLTSMGRGGWLAGFAGDGGVVVFSLDAPPRAGSATPPPPPGSAGPPAGESLGR